VGERNLKPHCTKIADFRKKYRLAKSIAGIDGRQVRMAQPFLALSGAAAPSPQQARGADQKMRTI